MIKSHIDDSDITTTDAVASLVLIKKHQERAKEESLKAIESTSMLEDLQFKKLMEFFPYAKAAYGFKFSLLKV